MRKRPIDGRERKLALAFAQRLEDLGCGEVTALRLQQSEDSPARRRRVGCPGRRLAYILQISGNLHIYDAISCGKEERCLPEHNAYLHMICKLCKLHVAAVAILLHIAMAHPAQAAGFLTGTVTREGAPVAGALVSAAGNNAVLQTTTDAQGHFSFPGVGVGTYTLTATRKDLQAIARVDVGGN